MKLSELANALGMELAGADSEFTGLNTLENATETEVSFLANPKYGHFLSTTRAVAVIVAREFAGSVKTALISGNPYFDFARAGSFFDRKQGCFQGIDPLAAIDPTATLGENCTVYPHAFIGPNAFLGSNTEVFPGAYVGENATLGKNCRILPNAVIMAGVTLGDGCVVKPGAVLGTDGFGYVLVAGEMQKIPQIGTVTIADGVHIGANTCIDKATLGSTSVGKDTKIDNLVQLGHNVQVGEQCFIISQVGVAGSARIGNRVTLAGQVGVAGHLHIGDGVTVGPQSGIAKDIPADTIGGGSPFMPEKTFMRSLVLAPRLPEIFQRVKKLEKELEELKSLLHNDTKENT